jgi:hypothetical protein
MFIMASSLSKEVEKSVSNRKKLRESVYDILDVAIFSFGCQAGLRSDHKIRCHCILRSSAYNAVLVQLELSLIMYVVISILVARCQMLSKRGKNNEPKSVEESSSGNRN